jgi:hypothetical protein
MALEKLELDMMVLDPSGLPVGGTPPAPGPLAASLLESSSSSSQPATPRTLTPATSAAAPTARTSSTTTTSSSSSGWLEDANNMAVERLLPSRLRQLSLGCSKPAPVSFQAAAAYVLTAGAFPQRVRRLSREVAVEEAVAQLSNVTEEEGSPEPATETTAPPAAAEPAEAGPSLVPAGMSALSAKAGKSYMGLPAR